MTIFDYTTQIKEIARAGYFLPPPAKAVLDAQIC
jgi:hypothetical protein